MQLLHLFDHSLVMLRDQPALEWEGRTYTFGELESRSNRVANTLRARGYTKGDRLGVYLPNRVELIDLYLACVKLGVIFVPINILYKDREIVHITGDAEPREVVTAERLACVTSSPSTSPPTIRARARCSTATRPPRSSTRPARRARRRAPCSPTTTSRRTR